MILKVPVWFIGNFSPKIQCAQVFSCQRPIRRPSLRHRLLKLSFFHFMNALSPDVVTLGNLFADILKKSLNLDIMPNLVECFPYDAAVTMITVTGAQLRRMLLHMLRDEVWQGAHCKFYQLSKGMRVVYDRQKHEFLELRFEGEQVRDDLCYTVGMPCLSHFCVWADNSLFALTEIGRSSKMII